MQFLDLDYNLLEREQDETVECCFEDVVLHPGPIDYVCIDDLALPLGYSYLFIKHDTLYHASSCGRYSYRKVLDTIPNGPLFPSIAYKQFNVAYIDFIWMERTDSNFNILYKRDNKFQYIGRTDYEIGKGFSITGFPNPFSDYLNISVEVKFHQYEPFIDIYNTQSRLVQRLNPESRLGNKYSFKWIPINSTAHIPPGIYFIRCTIGHNSISKIVIKTD